MNANLDGNKFCDITEANPNNATVNVRAVIERQSNEFRV